MFQATILFVSIFRASPPALRLAPPFLRWAALLLATLLGFAGPVAADAAAGEGRPNVLLIYVDDLGYGETGFQGNEQVPTPHIDSIADQGVRFTQGYATAAVCSPSRAALLAGRHQCRFGHEMNPPWGENWQEYGLPLEVETLAERLKARGYATAMTGKWHLGPKPHQYPTAHGFDYYYGQLDNERSYFTPDILEADAEGHRSYTVDEPGFYSAFAFADRAVDWLGRQAGESPWFLYFAPYNNHEPLHAPEAYIERFADGIADPERRIYAGMLAAMDEAVGRVLEAAERRSENLMVFFISDNGGPKTLPVSNGPLNGHKHIQLEGGIRVPFAMRWPGHIPGLVDYQGMVSTLDVAPTVLAAAGVEPLPPELEGVDLVPFLTGKRAGPPHETLFWKRNHQWTVRHGDWKLYVSGETVRLFDLAADIGETKNLANRRPDKVVELMRRWADWHEGNAEPLWWWREESHGKYRGPEVLLPRWERRL